MYYTIYFVIGIIIGLASCLKRWESYDSLPPAHKAYVKLTGDVHWFGFIVIFISRLILWPVYIIANILK